MLAQSAYRILPAIVLVSCGGDSAPTSTTPPTTMPACIQTVVFEGPSSFPANTLLFAGFSTTMLGRLDVTVDWTFPTTPVSVYIADQATCDRRAPVSCSFLASSLTGPKPRKLSAFNVPPRSYWLFVVNNGEERDACASQVVLSSPSCPAIATVGPEPNPGTMYDPTNRLGARATSPPPSRRPRHRSAPPHP